MSLGVPVTSLRNGFYASRGDAAGRAVETGELAAPEDGPVAWTSHDDLAEVADIALTDPTGHSEVIPGFFDVAFRDVGLSIGALALARLSREFAS